MRLKCVLYRDEEREPTILRAMDAPASVHALRRELATHTGQPVKVISYWNYRRERYDVLRSLTQLAQPEARLLTAAALNSSHNKKDQDVTNTSTFSSAGRDGSRDLYRAQLWLETSFVTVEQVDPVRDREEFRELAQHVKHFAGNTHVYYELTRAARLQYGYLSRAFDRVRADKLRAQGDHVKLLFYANNAWGTADVMKYGFQLLDDIPTSLEDALGEETGSDLASSVTEPAGPGRASPLSVELHVLPQDLEDEARGDTAGESRSSRRNPFTFTSSMMYPKDKKPPLKGPQRVILCEVAPGRSWVVDEPVTSIASAAAAGAKSRDGSRSRKGSNEVDFTLGCPPAGYDSVYYEEVLREPERADSAKRRSETAPRRWSRSPEKKAKQSATPSRGPLMQVMVGHSHQALPRYLLTMEPRKTEGSYLWGLTHPLGSTPESVRQKKAAKLRKSAGLTDGAETDGDGDVGTVNSVRALLRPSVTSPVRSVQARSTDASPTRSSTAGDRRQQRHSATPPRSGSREGRFAASGLSPPAQRTPTPTPERSTHRPSPHPARADTHSAADGWRTSPQGSLYTVGRPSSGVTSLYNNRLHPAGNTGGGRQTYVSDSRSVSAPRQSPAVSEVPSWPPPQQQQQQQQHQQQYEGPYRSPTSRTLSPARSGPSGSEGGGTGHVSPAVPRATSSGIGISVRDAGYAPSQRQRTAAPDRFDSFVPQALASNGDGPQRQPQLGQSAVLDDRSGRGGSSPARSTAVPASLRCPAHPSSLLNVYCATCQELTCAYCASIGSHRGHEVMEAETHVLAVRQHMQTLCHDLAQWLDHFSRVEQQLETERAEGQAQQGRRVRTLRAHLAEARRSLDVQERVLVKQLTDFDDRLGPPVEAAAAVRAKYEAALQPLEHCLQRYQAAAQAATQRPPQGSAALATMQFLRAAPRLMTEANNFFRDHDKYEETQLQTAVSSVRTANQQAEDLLARVDITELRRQIDALGRAGQLAARHPTITARPGGSTAPSPLHSPARPRPFAPQSSAMLDEWSTTSPLRRVETPVSAATSLLGRSGGGGGGSRGRTDANRTPPALAERCLLDLQRGHIWTIQNASRYFCQGQSKAVCSTPFLLKGLEWELRIVALPRAEERAGGVLLSSSAQGMSRSGSPLSPLMRPASPAAGADVSSSAPSPETLTLHGNTSAVVDPGTTATLLTNTSGADNGETEMTLPSQAPPPLGGAVEVADEDQWLGIFLFPVNHRMRLNFRVIAFSEVTWTEWKVVGWTDRFQGKGWGLYPFLRRRDLMRTDKLARDNIVKVCVAPLSDLY